METLIKDVADLILTRKSDGHVVLNTMMQLTGLEQTLTEERIKGGIGNKTIALMRNDKEVALNTRNAVFDLEWLAASQGVAIEENGTAVVTKYEVVKVASGAVAVAGTPVDNKIIIHDVDGSQDEATVTTGSATLPVGAVAVDGDEVTITYKEEITGDIVSMDAEKFAEKYKAELRTIEYSLDTDQVIADIYFIFDEVSPSGAFSLSLENGTAVAPEMNFTVLQPKNKSEFGRIIREMRA